MGTGYKAGDIQNLVLTASYGGSRDELIDRHGLRYARVVHSEAEAEDLGLELDHDDSHAMKPGPSFGLLIHGTQPAGSDAAWALVRELHPIRVSSVMRKRRADAIRLKLARASRADRRRRRPSSPLRPVDHPHPPGAQPDAHWESKTK